MLAKYGHFDISGIKLVRRSYEPIMEIWKTVQTILEWCYRLKVRCKIVHQYEVQDSVLTFAVAQVVVGDLAGIQNQITHYVSNFILFVIKVTLIIILYYKSINQFNSSYSAHITHTNGSSKEEN